MEQQRISSPLHKAVSPAAKFQFQKNSSSVEESRPDLSPFNLGANSGDTRRKENPYFYVTRIRYNLALTLSLLSW